MPTRTRSRTMTECSSSALERGSERKSAQGPPRHWARFPQALGCRLTGGPATSCSRRCSPPRRQRTSSLGPRSARRAKRLADPERAMGSRWPAISRIRPAAPLRTSRWLLAQDAPSRAAVPADRRPQRPRQPRDREQRRLAPREPNHPPQPATVTSPGSLPSDHRNPDEIAIKATRRSGRPSCEPQPASAPVPPQQAPAASINLEYRLRRVFAVTW
jgi:hypothetical protein